MGRRGHSFSTKLHSRRDVVPGAPAEVVDLARRVAVSAETDCQHREVGFGEALHHRQHLAARAAVSMEQQDAALLRIAAHEPRADFLAVGRLQAVRLPHPPTRPWVVVRGRVGRFVA